MLILESPGRVGPLLPCLRGLSSRVLSGSRLSHDWSCASPLPTPVIQSREAQGICHPPGARPCFRSPSRRAPASGRDGPCAPHSLLTTLLSPQERFVDLYGNNAAAEVRKGQETFNKWLLTGATVAGVLLLGSLLSRK